MTTQVLHNKHTVIKAPTVKLIHKKRIAKDSDGYITLRVGVPGEKQPVLKSLGYKIDEKDWDESEGKVRPSHPKANSINSDIGKAKQDLEHQFTIDKLNRVRHDRNTVTDLLGSNDGYGSFVNYWKLHIEFLSTPDTDGKTQVSPDYAEHLWVEWRKLIEFAGASLGFGSINTDFLRKYEVHLRKSVKATTLATKMKRVKEQVDRAINEQLIDPRRIANYRWPAYERPDRDYLTLEEVRKIEEKVYDDGFPDQATRIVAAYFAVECHSGIRFSDWKRFKTEKLIDNEAFKVRTKKNKEHVYLYLKHFPSLKRMLEFIDQQGWVFTETLQHANRLLPFVAKHCEIDKDLTTHIGRHTCATLLGECGYNDLQIAEILGISPDTVRVYTKATRRGLVWAQEKYGGW